MCPREFHAAYSGYLLKQEAQNRIVFEAARFNARAIMQIWSKKAIRNEHVARFPWDKNAKKKRGKFLEVDAVVQMLSPLSEVNNGKA